MPKLVKRLGEFTQGDYPKNRPRLKPEPVKEVETMFEDDWQEYQQEQAAEKKKRTFILQQKKDALQRWEEERKNRQRGMLLKLSAYGLSLLNLGRHFLKEQQVQVKRKFRQTVENQAKLRSKLNPSGAGLLGMALVSPYSGDCGKDLFPAYLSRNSLFRNF